MLIEDRHISDQELLQAADGELSGRRAGQVNAHLEACWHCRTRRADIEGTIADFVRGNRHALDAQLPSPEGPRALLRARLADLAHEPGVRGWQWHPHFAAAARAAGLVLALSAVVLAGGLALRSSFMRPSLSAALQRDALPERALTPGATRAVAVRDVCSMLHEEVVGQVSEPMRDEVLRQYGIRNAHAGDYEIDYLIAPGLGGAEDIHNLWPEPSGSEPWNASVKDALEERLHQMVCSGSLDLPTAQHDIATDWIAAYKKYFHTDAPLSVHSRVGRLRPPAIHENAPQSSAVLLVARNDGSGAFPRFTSTQ